MTEKNKILILVPDGVGIKNYLYSEVFKQTSASLVLFHNFDADTLDTIQKNISLTSSLEIPNYSESPKEKFYRETIHLARLRWNAKQKKNPTILKFWKRGHRGFKLRLFYKLVYLRALFVSSYSSILKLEKKYDKVIRENPFYEECKAVFEREKPDTIFCTHQRALKAPGVFAAANDLNIKTVTVIYSWDNIPKARLALRANKYLVWSQFMKKELESFYPEIPSSQITITGTPQFEFYSNGSNIIERDTFFNFHGLDKNKRIICFSGDDVKTSPYDPQYLNDIAEAIVANGLDSTVQIAFRRCPVDVSGRYDWVIRKYPQLIKNMPPLWNFNSDLWSAVYPTFDDVKLLVSLAFYSDLVVNVGSTMAFDFGMFKNPCMFINYDYVKDPNWSVDIVYRYQHFRSMPSEKAVYWLNSKEEIAEKVRLALNEPNTTIKEWFDVVIEDATKASELIIKELH